MARGKKTDPLTVYKVMLSYVTTHNYAETARILNVPEGTVRMLIENNKDKDEFKELLAEKQEDFIKEATSIIDKGTKLLNRRLDTALESQDELDEMIHDIYADPDTSPQKKQGLAQKVSSLQLNNLKEITTAVGTMYDKRALAKGESTSNVNVRKLEDLL